MKTKDAARWQQIRKNNQDTPYSACAVWFAEAWADAMEARIAAGERLEDVADATMREVNHRPEARGGITGFMYGWIVAVLADCWVHGEALRRRHNLKVQLGTEGERANAAGRTLNPAMVVIDEPEPS